MHGRHLWSSVNHAAARSLTKPPRTSTTSTQLPIQHTAHGRLQATSLQRPPRRPSIRRHNGVQHTLAVCHAPSHASQKRAKHPPVRAPPTAAPPPVDESDDDTVDDDDLEFVASYGRRLEFLTDLNADALYATLHHCSSAAFMFLSAQDANHKAAQASRLTRPHHHYPAAAAAAQQRRRGRL